MVGEVVRINGDAFVLVFLFNLNGLNGVINKVKQGLVNFS